MKKLKVIFFICIVAGIAGCFCEDCTYKEEKLHAYANKSGETVKVIAIVGGYTQDWTERVYNNYEKFIDDGDTLHSSFYFKEKPEEWYVPYGEGCGLVSYGECDKPIRMELHFLNELEKCLIFDGPIKNDGIDMRSWDSYERGKEIKDWADFWVGIEYVYTITPEHKAMSKEEDCRTTSE